MPGGHGHASAILLRSVEARRRRIVALVAALCRQGRRPDEDEADRHRRMRKLTLALKAERRVTPSTAPAPAVARSLAVTCAPPEPCCPPLRPPPRPARRRRRQRPRPPRSNAPSAAPAPAPQRQNAPRLSPTASAVPTSAQRSRSAAPITFGARMASGVSACVDTISVSATRSAPSPLQMRSSWRAAFCPSLPAQISAASGPAVEAV